MATVTKRNRNFQIIVSLGYDQNGKQIRKSTTYKPPQGTTPKKAEKLAKAFAVDFERKCNGLASLDENMKFSELVQQYFKLYAPNELKSVTAYTYKGQCDKHLLPAFGNIKLKDFSTARISTFFNQVDLQPASCRKLLIILKSIFSFAVKQGFLKETPCKNIIMPKDNKSLDENKPILTEKQIHQLLNMLDNDTQFSTIIKTLLYTGMRCGECLGLQWTDVDFKYNLIHIRHALADVGGKHWLDTPKTKNSIRTIALSDELKLVLLTHRERQQAYFTKHNIENPNNMIFTSKTGGFKDRSQLLSEFKKFIKNTDFNNISLHSLRHANATLLLANGIDIKLVSAHLGHSTVSTTADIYSDVLEKSKRQMAELISLKLT